MKRVQFKANVQVKIESSELDTDKLTERDTLHVVAALEQLVNEALPVSLVVQLEDLDFERVNLGSGSPGPVFDLYPRYHFKKVEVLE